MEMNKIEIKQELFDYDDVIENKELQLMEHDGARDIHLIDIKGEQEDENPQFNHFHIVNEGDDIITLAPTADKSQDELNFIQLLDMFGEIKKRKILDSNDLHMQPKQLRETHVGNSEQYNVYFSSNFEKILPNTENMVNGINIKEEANDQATMEVKSVFRKSLDTPKPIPKIKIPASLFNSLKNDSKTNIYSTNIDALQSQNHSTMKIKTPTASTLNLFHFDKITAPATAKLSNNILQPIKLTNNAFILNTTAANTTTITNNIKILQLPPNTKIIKLDGKQSLHKKNNVITASTPITSIQIKQGENSTHTYVVTSSLVTESSLQTTTSENTGSLIKIIQQQRESEQLIKHRILSAQKSQKSIHFVSKPALDFIENLPESRKAINELLQQVKKAEITSSTITSKKANIEKQNMRNTQRAECKSATNLLVAENLTRHSVNADNILNTETRCEKFEWSGPNSSSNPPTIVTSSNENVIQVVHMALKSNDSHLLKAKRANPNNRCFWLCPRCPRQYAQRSTMRHHLENHHSLDYNEIDNLILEVRIIRIGTESLRDMSAINEIDNLMRDKTAANTPSKSITPDIAKDTNETTYVSEADTGKFSSQKGKKRRDCYNYKCDKCGRRCSSKITLIDHIVANCSRDPQYQCSQCPKKFYSVSTLNCHVTIHTGELPHKCNYCEKRFRTRGQVTVHHRTHTGERPFKCQVCSQCFTHRETLIAHLSRHIGMKRYKCYGCTKLFSCISGLRTHRETRPDTCGKVKFNPRALGPRVRVVKGSVIFEPQPEINPYLRSEEPPTISPSSE